MKTMFFASSAAVLAAIASCAGTLQEAIDAAAGENPTVSVETGETVSAPVVVSRSMILQGQVADRPLFAAADGYKGPVFKISGDGIYVQIKNIAVSGATGIAVNAGDGETSRASLRLLNCDISASEKGIVFANGGASAGASFTEEDYSLPKEYALAVQGGTIECSAASAPFGSSALDIRGVKPSAPRTQTLVGMTRISGFETAVSVADDVEGATVYFRGAASVETDSSITCGTAVRCAGKNCGFYFRDAALAAVSGNLVELAAGAENTVIEFAHDRNVLDCGTGHLVGALSADAISAIAFFGAASVSSSSSHLCELADPSSWRDYKSVDAAASGLENASSGAYTAARQFAAAKGTVLYATKAAAKADIAEDELKLTIRFPNGRPVVEPARTEDRYGVSVAVKYAERLSGEIDWKPWSEDVVSESLPESLFFKAYVEE